MRLLFLLLLSASAAAHRASPSYENVSLPTGVTLSTLVAGNASAAAPVILFLHGFPAGSWMWSSVVADAALASFRLVAPDLRGYNRSSAPVGVADASPQKKPAAHGPLHAALARPATFPNVPGGHGSAAVDPGAQ